MAGDWKELTDLTGEAALHVCEVKVKSSGVCIRGDFELPPLARLPAQDQIFVAMFVKCHGSIKEMERYFGVSYPTIKARLNTIATRLADFTVEVSQSIAAKEYSASEILDKFANKELNIDEAVDLLNARSTKRSFRNIFGIW
ncbi:MAG: DUF2089 family protein [Bdellovibrionota bacterium]